MRFSTISRKPISGKCFSSTFLQISICHHSPGVERKQALLNLYILVHIFQRFSNTSDSKHVLL